MTYLSETHREAIRRHIPRFRRFMETEEFRQEQADREERERFFQHDLLERLEEFSEVDVEALLGRLWASRIWGNKAYQAQKIIADNGLENLRAELKRLMTSEDPEQAYEEFLNRIKGLGPASVTEMLAYRHPNRCGIWNDRTRAALRILGLTAFVNPKRYRISAGEYRVFNQLLQAIASELEASGIAHVDLLLVDFFLYEVARTEEEEEAAPPEEQAAASDFDHDEVCDLIVLIGHILGFDTDTEVKIAHGATVDVVWRTRIANLGQVAYVFEVHRQGSIDSLILNLQKARNAPHVQKVIAVSDKDRLERIRRECEGLPEEFRRALRFWSVVDVMHTAEHLQRAMEAINALGLIEEPSLR